MKTIGMILSFFLMICTVQAQLVDIPKNAASAANIAPTVALMVIEKKLKKEAKDFAKIYASRLLYTTPLYLATGMEDPNNKIRRQLDNALKRRDSLKIKNDALPFIYYRKKKDNTKTIAAISYDLDRLNQEMTLAKLGKYGINGEKENVYHNLMITLVKFHREMDVVESNIASSIRVNQLLTNIKNR